MSSFPCNVLSGSIFEISAAKILRVFSVERTALLLYASSTQVNFLMPAGTAPGLGQVTIKNDSDGVFHGVSLIRSLAPGLFAANSNGAGVAAAVVFRIAGDGTQSYEPVAQFEMTLSVKLRA